MPAADIVCGRQKKSNNVEYRMSRHCIETGCLEGRLLFNTLTGMLILIENENDFKENRDELIAHRFLVPIDFDEMKYADQVLKVATLLKSGKKQKNSFTILTTTDCNARCFYCYEAGVSKCTMTEKTAADVATYIISSSKGAEVELRWFGGEPLMNPAVIDIICSRLSEAGVKYRSGMITNGFCFDDKTAEKAVKLWNLRKVQITLDGMSEVYNKVKAYTDSKGDDFAVVIDNISRAKNAGTEVIIRLNMTAENPDELMQLVDYLAEKFEDKNGIYVVPGLVGNYSEKDPFDYDLETADKFLKLRKRIKEKGFVEKKKLLPSEFKANNCKADNDACEIILPDGRLCKCEHELENECFGSIYSDERDDEVIASWKERVVLPECVECPLYPMCINLKKCAWSGDCCPEAVRYIRINRYKEQIIEAYNSRKDNIQ